MSPADVIRENYQDFLLKTLGFAQEGSLCLIASDCYLCYVTYVIIMLQWELLLKIGIMSVQGYGTRPHREWPGTEQALQANERMNERAHV